MAASEGADSATRYTDGILGEVAMSDETGPPPGQGDPLSLDDMNKIVDNPAWRAEHERLEALVAQALEVLFAHSKAVALSVPYTNAQGKRMAVLAGDPMAIMVCMRAEPSIIENRHILVGNLDPRKVFNDALDLFARQLVDSLQGDDERCECPVCVAASKNTH